MRCSTAWSTTRRTCFPPTTSSTSRGICSWCWRAWCGWRVRQREAPAAKKLRPAHISQVGAVPSRLTWTMRARVPLELAQRAGREEGCQPARACARPAFELQEDERAFLELECLRTEAA